MHAMHAKRRYSLSMGSLNQLLHAALALPNASLLAHCTRRPPAPLRPFIALALNLSSRVWKPLVYHLDVNCMRCGSPGRARGAGAESGPQV